jgi:hypothetical protein
MADAAMVLLMTGFVILCVGYVAWCDRLLGDDPAPVERDEVVA